MAREVQQKEIDGVKFNISPLKPTKSIKLLVRIAKMIGAPIGALLKGAKGDSSVLDHDLDLDQIVSALTERLDEDNVIDLITYILQGTQPLGVDSNKMLNEQFDFFFDNYELDMVFKVVKMTLEVNYSSFFGESGVIASLKQKALSTQT